MDAQTSAGKNDTSRPLKAKGVRLAILLALIGLALANLGRTALDVKPKYPLRKIGAALQVAANDEVALEDQRYQKLRQVLQDSGAQGAVGYITEVNREDVLTDPEIVRRYYLSQYALAPIIVTDVPGQYPYVIGDFGDQKIAS